MIIRKAQISVLLGKKLHIIDDVLGYKYWLYIICKIIYSLVTHHRKRRVQKNSSQKPTVVYVWYNITNVVPHSTMLAPLNRASSQQVTCHAIHISLADSCFWTAKGDHFKISKPTLVLESFRQTMCSINFIDDWLVKLFQSQLSCCKCIIKHYIRKGGGLIEQAATAKLFKIYQNKIIIYI